MKEGVRFIHQQPLFRWLILLTFIGMFFSQSYIQIMPAFADLLGGGEAAFGYLLSAGGVGSVVGTLLVGSIQGHRHLGRLMLGGAALAAATTMLFGVLATSGIFLLGLATAFLAAAFASVFLISSMSVMQLSVPDGLRGRVMGIHAMGFSLMPLGGLFIGALAGTLGAPGAVVLGSSVYLLCILAVAAGQPFIRGLSGPALGGEAAGRRDRTEAAAHG
jgi:MFS family permease